MATMRDRVDAVVRETKVVRTTLSKKLGKPDNFISRVAGGFISGAESVELLARGLGVDPLWLTTGSVDLAPKWMSEARARALAGDPGQAASTGDADAMVTIGRLTMEIQRIQAEKAALEAMRQSLEAQVSELSLRLSRLEAGPPQRSGGARSRGKKP